MNGYLIIHPNNVVIIHVVPGTVFGTRILRMHSFHNGMTFLTFLQPVSKNMNNQVYYIRLINILFVDVQIYTVDMEKNAKKNNDICK